MQLLPYPPCKCECAELSHEAFTSVHPQRHAFVCAVACRAHAVNERMSCAVVHTLRLALTCCPKEDCRRTNDGLRPCEHTKVHQSTTTMQPYKLAESCAPHYCYCMHSAVLHWPPLPATDLSPLPNSCSLKVLLVSLPAQPPVDPGRAPVHHRRYPSQKQAEPNHWQGTPPGLIRGHASTPCRTCG